MAERPVAKLPPIVARTLGERDLRADRWEHHREAVDRTPGTIITRPGRVRGDGTRVGGKTVQKKTIYLRPELGAWLERRSFERREPESAIIEAALELYRATHG